MPSIQDNVKVQNKSALLDIAGPPYQGLKKIIDLNIFQFHVTPAVSLLLVDNLVKSGGVLTISKRYRQYAFYSSKNRIDIGSGGFDWLVVIQFLVYFLFTPRIDRLIRRFTLLLELASFGDLTRELEAFAINALKCSEIKARAKKDCPICDKEGCC